MDEPDLRIEMLKVKARNFTSALAGDGELRLPEDNHFFCRHLTRSIWNTADPIA